MATSETGLRECPFCGAYPRLIYHGGDIKKWEVSCCNPKCKIQPATDYHRYKWIIIREWNKRCGSTNRSE